MKRYALSPYMLALPLVVVILAFYYPATFAPSANIFDVASLHVCKFAK